MKSIIVMSLLALTTCTPAFAQSNGCSETNNLTSILENDWEEYTRMVGLLPNGNLLSVLVNEDTGTFTVIESSPQGISCLRTAGNDFYFVDAPVEEAY